MYGSGAVSCSCSLLIRGPILPAVRQELHLSPCADSRNRLCEIARALGVSVMTLYRWRKAPPGSHPVREADQADGMRGRGDRIAELQLENSRLRRLVTDLLLEKVKLEEVAQRQSSIA